MKAKINIEIGLDDETVADIMADSGYDNFTADDVRNELKGADYNDLQCFANKTVSIEVAA